MLLLGGFAFLDNIIRQYTTNPVLMALMFFGILGLIADIPWHPIFCLCNICDRRAIRF